MALRTDFKNDVLDTSVNTNRKWEMTENADGTVSFTDETVYSQVGDDFGAEELNETNNEVNQLSEVVADLSDTVDDLSDETSDYGFEDGILPVLHGGTGVSTEKALKTFLGNLMYPVGSIYMSVNDTNPENLFGGTWARIQDRFLLASGSSYSAGSTGGEASHTLTTNEMPTHSHYVPKVGVQSLANGNFNILYDTDGGLVKATSEAGGNLPHNNMPPYLAVYMWKRIA